MPQLKNLYCLQLVPKCHLTNINWRDVNRKNVVNNVDTMYVMIKGTMTKWPVQKPTNRTTQTHVEHQNATGI